MRTAINPLSRTSCRAETSGQARRSPPARAIPDKPSSAPIRRIRANPCSIPASGTCAGWIRARRCDAEAAPSGHGMPCPDLQPETGASRAMAGPDYSRQNSSQGFSSLSVRGYPAHRATANVHIRHIAPGQTLKPSTFNLPTFNLQPRLTPPPSAPSPRCNPSASRDRGCAR